MIFLRPTIIRDDMSLNDISGEKYDLIRAYQLDRQERGISLMPFTDKPVLPERGAARELLQQYKIEAERERDGKE